MQPAHLTEARPAFPADPVDETPESADLRPPLVFWKKAFPWTVLGIGILLWCSAAAGYVLPGRAVLHYYAESLGDEKTLLILQEVSIRTEAPGLEERIVPETVRYRFPGAFRSEAVFGPTRRLHLHVDGKILTVLDENILSPGRDRFDRYKDLLLCRNREQLERLLSRYGIQYEICSLGRFEDAVVYVLGARYPDTSASRLVMDKEHFWPLRWIFVEGSGPSTGETLEIRYNNWARIGSAWYPWRIEFYQNGELARTIRVQSLEVNPPTPEALFDMAALKSKVRPAQNATSNVERDAPVSDEIQKTIDAFKNMYN
ncbi:MAG: hypothetical protein JRI76_10485 [Deltaproteobacteria bacterium]|nr:hypothetical protein [Deltaproteobacteria bacterium]